MSVVIAIIPARGGSKGIELKNMTLVGDRPLIAYTIERALESNEIQQVYVSTDHPTISSYAASLGTIVVTRPNEISGDHAQIEDAMSHMFENFAIDSDWAGAWTDDDLVVLLQPTSPLRRPHDIDGAIRHLRDGQFDSVFSATPIFPYVWMPAGSGDGTMQRAFREHELPRLNRQDRQPMLQENGAIYVTRIPYFLAEHNRLSGHIGHYRMPPFTALEIDTEFDIAVAAITMSVYQETLQL